jgi:hypothetical protein
MHVASFDMPHLDMKKRRGARTHAIVTVPLRILRAAGNNNHLSLLCHVVCGGCMWYAGGVVCSDQRTQGR